MVACWTPPLAPVGSGRPISTAGQRSVTCGYEAQRLSLPSLPVEAEQFLPVKGPERLLAANQLALLSRAPADARGYRVDIQNGSRHLMRWFPRARFRTPVKYMLEPFKLPAVPLVGTYAVVYLNERCRPIGGPRFTLDVEQADRQLMWMDWD